MLFYVLVCCRSLVQIGVQKGEIEQKWKLDPCQCDRVHLVRSSALRSSLRGVIECIHIDPHFPCCLSQPYALSLQHLRCGNSEAVIWDRSHLVWSNAVRSNATLTIERTWSWHGLEIKCSEDDQMQAGLRSIAPPTIDRTTYDRAHP